MRFVKQCLFIATLFPLSVTTKADDAGWKISRMKYPYTSPYVSYSFAGEKTPIGGFTIWCNSKGGFIFQFRGNWHYSSLGWSGLIVSQGDKSVTIATDSSVMSNQNNITENAGKIVDFIEGGLRSSKADFTFEPEHISSANDQDAQATADMSGFDEAKKVMDIDCPKYEASMRGEGSEEFYTGPLKHDIKGFTIGMTEEDANKIISDRHYECLKTEGDIRNIECDMTEGSDKNRMFLSIGKNNMIWAMNYLFYFHGQNRRRSR